MDSPPLALTGVDPEAPTSPADSTRTDFTQSEGTTISSPHCVAATILPADVYEDLAS